MIHMYSLLFVLKYYYYLFRSWEEGKVFIFDDSFEHEVWHNGTEFRLVLIIDVWHPELTAGEKRALTPI